MAKEETAKTEATATADVTPTGTTNGTVGNRTVDGFMEYLARRAGEENANIAFEISAQQLDEIFKAGTPDELFAILNKESVGSRDLEGVEMRVDSFTVHVATKFKAPLGHYYMVRANRLSDGEDLLFDTNAPLIMGILRWYEAKEMLPAELVIRGAETPEGRRLWMEPVPKRAMAGQTA